ncbi:MAG: B12-binding domain-containing radical SAM protein [Nitrospirae bacterium]|nr:B12-binding domain-containing radical SAM protein [Nitrospirota bacterium]MBF0617693.1 B12-binding domain-containing radical SAM protein [Nitrospirota bacterium]
MEHILFIKDSFSIEGEPMGVMQLSAIAKMQGFNTCLCSSKQDYKKLINKHKPAAIAISMLSGEYTSIKTLIGEIKRYADKIPIIVGGPHPTFAPSALEDFGVEAICTGEGDRAFTEILKRIGAGTSFDGIPNIHTKTQKTPRGPLIENLDELPFIDRELYYEASPVNRRFKMRSFYSSRGCPYGCTYCFNHAYNKLNKGLGRVVRKRSVENLIEELEIVTKKYDTQYIRFSDDVFTHAADDWLEKFSKEYKRKIGIPFYCLVRSNSVTKDMVTLLKNAGCNSVCMCIEAANADLRRLILNRNLSNETIIKSFDLFNGSGIHTYSNSMLALPTATLKDELDSLDLNIRCKPTCGLFSILLPYPGTEIHDYCIEHNLLDKDYNFEDISRSVGSYSMLSSFTDKEKKIQKNIVFLGPLVIKLPFLKKLFVKYLIYMPNNFIFLFIHYCTKYYLFKKYIIPMRYTLTDYLHFMIATLKSEFKNMGVSNKDTILPEQL